MLDADKYYTPIEIACNAFERADLPTYPAVCADTACGTGRLLSAAEAVFEAKHCVGIDRDPRAIRELRRQKPDWRLYVSDLLKRHRAPAANFSDGVRPVDLLVLNPPFSLGARKYVEVAYQGQEVKCSVAMAHVLRSLELFSPCLGALAVAPESMLFSQTDEHARELLSTKYQLRELASLSIYTFKGARVHSSFVQIKNACSGTAAVPRKTAKQGRIEVSLVRGGLQMHAFERVESGALVIHSTALSALAVGDLSKIKDKTCLNVCGQVSGWMLLLPRVGAPKSENFQPCSFPNIVQLSDCVIGLQFNTKGAMLDAHERIKQKWDQLVLQYRGTGARYITMERLAIWLESLGIFQLQSP
ncbi:hypothetical protein RBI13_06390 [Alcaligenaceae bacterium A4P071]|nr:hypothetical protein [Alcaligenaceae bacterium A4P071]